MNISNRRRLTRHRSLLPVKIKIPGEDKWIRSTVININRTGACFASNLPYSPNEKLEVDMFQIKKLVPATVIWCHPVKDMSGAEQEFKVGIEYPFAFGHHNK